MAVNWQRWVTSWRASHSRNSRGLEPVQLLEGHHVGPHEVDEVLVLDGVLGEQQVVLAEHPGRQPAQHQSHLGAGGRPPGAGQGAGQPLGHLVGGRHAGRVQLLEVGADQPLEAGHVGVDPPGAVGDPGPGRARGRAEPGGRGHQLLGLGGQLLEVGLEEVGPVGGGQVAAAPDPSGHPFGGVPRHGTAAVGRRRRSRRTSPDRCSSTRSGSVTVTSVGTGRIRAAARAGRRRPGAASVGLADCARLRRASATRSMRASGTWSLHRLAMTLRSSVSKP